MSFISKHNYLDVNKKVSVTTNNDSATVRYSASGTMSIRFPGKLFTHRYASYDISTFYKEQGHQESHPSPPGRWHTTTKALPLTLEIRTPDGELFTADQVTLNDIKRFRDLRGISQGNWTYKIFGESAPISIILGMKRVMAGKVRASIIVEENINSKSARPLVDKKLTTTPVFRYTFDLYRIGTFTATTKNVNLLLPNLYKRPLRLIDPDGIVVRTSSTGTINYPVNLRTLDKSRDALGRVRPWILEVQPFTNPNFATPVKVWATVIATSTISTSTLQERIDSLFGVDGNKISLYGETAPDKMLARLKILDEISAETINMHGLLDSILENEEQDQPGKDIKKGVAYTVASHSRNFGYESHVSLNNVKITSLSISIGASQKITPSLPALKIDIRTQGDATFKIGGFPLATIKVRNNHIQMEVGMKLNAEGTFSHQTWITSNLVDVDVHWAAAVAAGIVSFGLITLGAIGLAEYIEGEFNRLIPRGFNSVTSSFLNKVPQILAVIHGDDFTYTSLRLQGNNIVFDYEAPLEPEPKPNKDYRGIIGRSLLGTGAGIWQTIPRSLGDTWKADNLAKIDHIVVVMMENRSFDHVLGYRAQIPGNSSSDGLTTGLVQFLKDNDFRVKKLNQSGIVPNTLGYKTKFPASVGHELDDVTEQLSERLSTLEGRSINSPKGFISNFTERAAGHPELTLDDVLGYYEADDLPFYKYLAENYAYCEKFYCSHAGPTLPNRMFSLTGDLQYDRTGEAVPNNNNHDNFYLSRATTIFDLLTRKNIPWRVYESSPSVTMLRMFARYATDNTNIVKISKLQEDVDAGNLPAVTIIDPNMHTYPENDDHSPHADMYNGQVFLKGIYDTLRRNDTLWQKTMLIITYDEHGGFYDHVVPPVADLREKTDHIVVQRSTKEASAKKTQSKSAAGILKTTHVTTNYGLRVPTFVVSPWTVAGKGPDNTLDFCSILKTILARFCATDKPFLSDRVHASKTFNDYLSSPQARMNVMASPAMVPLPMAAQLGKRQITTAPVTRTQLESGEVDYHDLTGMLARMLGR